MPSNPFLCHRTAGRLRDDAGNALVELALLLPMLILVMLCAIDFGRIFYAANAVSQAVSEGVNWGTTHPSDLAGMQSKASASATAYDLSVAGFGATAACECRGANGGPVNNACVAGSCNIGTRYVSVTGTYTFQTVMGYTGLRSSFPISRTAWMQAP